ncbi:armadillo-type protein [Mycena metata]|uniref:Armadillo-type protein n=1 Tax=Mycena metata TaxID=1033252 RepID=A0AAD7M7V6_9AGAR|nr:armadillo-type protein [Mycena metata]
MPPLTRQRTPQSLHSEWSRSTLGATISIHAFAKPLMKVMYHRAVVDLIKHQRDIPLSAETMQIYTSYLGWKYVAETTKTLILREIQERTLVEVEAHVFTDFLVSYEILLDSTNGVVQNWTCRILGRLASRPSTRGAVIAAQPCPKLVTLLSDADAVVVEGACDALLQISCGLDGATAVVKAGALKTVQNLLTSPRAGVRRWTSKMLAELAFHPSTRGAVVTAQPCPRLVTLLGDNDADVVEGACDALLQISHDVDGARAVIKAGALETVQNLLTSPRAGVRRQTFEMLAGLTFHPSTRGAVVAAQLCPQFVALLDDNDAAVVEGACHALLQISRGVDGARAVVKAGALQIVQNLLTSPRAGVQRWSSEILAELAFYPSTREPVVAAQPCPQLVALLGDDNTAVVEGACTALTQISRDLDGAEAVVEAGALRIVKRLLASPRVGVRRWTSKMLAELTIHPLTREAVVAAQLCSQLVTLLGNGDAAVVDGACAALAQISRDLDGAEAVVEAGVLGIVKHLLASPRVGVRRWTSKMLAELAIHPLTREAVVAAQLCPQIVTLLSSDDAAIVEGACDALSQISRDVDGAKAVVNAGEALGTVEHLLLWKIYRPNVTRW